MRLRMAVFAFVLSLSAVQAAVMPGWPWNENKDGWETAFADSRAFATAHKAPLVVFWGHTKCKHCNWFKKNVKDSSALKSWLGTHPAVMCFKDDIGWTSGTLEEWKKTWPADYRAAYDWIGEIGPVGDFPKIGVRWEKPDGTTVAAAFTWAHEGSAKSFVSKLNGLIGGYEAGYSFVAGTTPCNRLEAFRTTAFVDVPLSRTVLGEAQTILVATFPAGAVTTNEIAWAETDYSKLVRVEIPEGALASGATVDLLHGSVDGTVPTVGSSVFVIDAEPENGPKNPRWIGERTLETLGAGEWTMDYDLVRARAAAKGSPALVLVGGSLWCPDCVKTDHYLVETPEFRAWLLSNDVSCAAIDVPNVAKEGMNTSLLTYEPYSTSDRYVDATTPKQERVQGGAGYLSRHAVPQEGNGGTNATAIAARNLDLINRDTGHGGLCRPENMSGDNAETGPFKTGIPCLIVLRPDGTVAGRLYQFNNVSPGDTKSLAAYINRMNELVDLCGDSREECNADWRTTEDDLAFTDEVTAGLSAMDLADWYKLPEAEHFAEGEVRAVSAAVPAEAAMRTEQNVALSLYRVGADGTNAVKTVKGNLFSGVTLPVAVEADGAKWYVSVRAIDTSRAFAITRKDVSTAAYALTSDIGYRESAAAFEKAAMKVSEKTAGTLKINVLREGGGAGALQAKVVLDEEATTALPATYVWEDRDLSWADGETDPKSVALTILNDSVWDGNRTVALKITEVTGEFVKAETTGPTNLTVTVTEDDKKAVGKLAIAETDPAMAKAMTVIVREGSVLDIGVERLSGASGAVTAEVVTAKGALSSNLLVWAHNDRVSLKHVELAVPTLAELGTTSFKVSLRPHAGIKADSARKTLTVKVVAADAPGFADPTRDYALRQYVAFSDEIGVLNWKGGRLVLKKTSGSLPSGVKAKLVLEGTEVKLVLSGTPTKVKDCSAVYQVSEERPKADPTKVGTVAGTTVKLVFSVRDITKPGKDGQAANPFVAKSHTYGNIPVLGNQSILDGASRFLAGRLTVTVPKSGKVSAKYLCRAGTVSFSSSSWASCDPATGLLTAVLKPKVSGFALTVAVDAGGELRYGLADRDVPGDALEGTATVAPWNKTTKLAKAWKGYYTVDCPATNLLSGVEGRVPSGDAWFALKMTSSSAVDSGKMTYAGRLPNGVSFSGSGILLDRGETAGLPVGTRTSADYFTAYAEIAADAAAAYSAEDEHRCMLAVEGVEPRWSHYEAKSAGDCCEVGYGLYGAYYDAGEEIEYCARKKFPGVQLMFTTGGAIGEIPFNVTASKPYIDKDSAAYAGNPNALTVSFKKSTGVLHGTFKFTPPGGTARVTATYYGVLLPGWGGCGTCKPGETFRPLFVGSFWYSEKVSTKLSVKRGGAFGIGETEEQENDE